MHVDRRPRFMEGQFTGSTALIPPDRAGWEAIPRPVSVLIGKFIKPENRYPYYYTDSPDLEHNFPDQAIELGASWYWDAKDLCKLPVRVFDAALDIPEGVAFEFPPPVRVPRASTRWSRPELSPDYPSTVAEKISAYSFHPAVYESLEMFDAAFLSSPHKAKSSGGAHVHAVKACRPCVARAVSRLPSQSESQAWRPRCENPQRASLPEPKDAQGECVQQGNTNMPCNVRRPATI